MEFLIRFLAPVSKSLNGATLFFLFFLLVIFLVALSFGKTRIALALVATYLSAFLESIFWYQPNLEKLFDSFLSLPSGFWSRLLVFILFFIISFLILNRSILKPKMSLQESPPFTILFLSIVLGVFWLSILTSYLPGGGFAGAGWPAKSYLTMPNIKFIIAALPLAGLLFVKRKRSLLE